MLNIEKVDPKIVRLILDKTGKDFVHQKDEPLVDREGRHKEGERKRDPRALPEKIRCLNALFEANGVDIYLVAAEDENGKALQVKVYEKSSGRLIRMLSEEEIGSILEKVMGDSGIIFDRKG